MKLGLHLPDVTWPAAPGRLRADLAAVARSADEAVIVPEAAARDRRVPDGALRGRHAGQRCQRSAPSAAMVAVVTA